MSLSRTGFRGIGLAALYTALALGANAALAQSVDVDALEALRAGEMKKLAVEPKEEPVPDAALSTPEGEAHISDYRGTPVVLNFWATWCVPCREEMPTLDALQTELGEDAVAVVPVATGRNPLPAVRRFFDEEGVEALPILRDPDQSLARAMGVLGLPVTVLLDSEGREIARLTGGADWSSDSARAILARIGEAG